MGFQKGNPGKQPGTKHRKTKEAEEIIKRFRLNPLEFHMMVVNNDWEGLGYDSESKISYTSAGIEFEEPRITVSDRISSANTACKFIYPTLKSVEHSTADPRSDLTPSQQIEKLEEAILILKEAAKTE